MSFWKTCDNCGAMMNEPTIREAVNDMYACPQCTAPNYSNKTKGDLIIELLERIEKLEEDAHQTIFEYEEEKDIDVVEQYLIAKLADAENMCRDYLQHTDTLQAKLAAAELIARECHINEDELTLLYDLGVMRDQLAAVEKLTDGVEIAFVKKLDTAHAEYSKLETKLAAANKRNTKQVNDWNKQVIDGARLDDKIRDLKAELAASIEESETDFRMRREAEDKLSTVKKASQFSYMSINDGNLAEHGYVAVKLEKIIALEEALKC
jgi:hypothetical protein